MLHFVGPYAARESAGSGTSLSVDRAYEAGECGVMFPMYATGWFVVRPPSCAFTAFSWMDRITTTRRFVLRDRNCLLDVSSVRIEAVKFCSVWTSPTNSLRNVNVSVVWISD